MVVALPTCVDLGPAGGAVTGIGPENSGWGGCWRKDFISVDTGIWASVFGWRRRSGAGGRVCFQVFAEAPPAAQALLPPPLPCSGGGKPWPSGGNLAVQQRRGREQLPEVPCALGGLQTTLWVVPSVPSSSQPLTITWGGGRRLRGMKHGPSCSGAGVSGCSDRDPGGPAPRPFLDFPQSSPRPSPVFTASGEFRGQTGDTHRPPALCRNL